MEITEIYAMESARSTHQPDWLRDTISSAEQKMKTILNLWEENNSLLQNDEMYEKRKAAVTKEVQDLCISYCLLAKKYDRMKSVSTNASSSLSNLGSNIHGLKHTEVSGSWDDSQWKAINSNPESCTEDGDNECNGDTHDFYHLRTFVHNMKPKDENSIKPETAWLDMKKFKLSTLVEENARLQVELIRRNNEKREAIKKLQNQVNRLIVENDALHRSLIYHDHNRQHVKVHPPKRKSTLLDKFLAGCS